MPVIEKGTVRYVQFARIDDCDYDPDLILCVYDLNSEDILLHATDIESHSRWTKLLG